MRVVIAAEGTRGDVYPMLALGAALQDKGHDVIVCAPPDFREPTEARKLAFHPVGRNVRAYLECESVALHSGAFAMTSAGERFFKENLHAQMRDLANGADGADVIFAAGTQLAASSIAEYIGADYRFVAYDPGVIRSAERPPAMLPFANVPRRLVKLTWALLLFFMDRRIRPKLDRERSYFGLPRVRHDLYHQLVGRRPILAAEELLAPAPSDTGAPQTIGCLHSFEQTTLPEKLQDFLDAGEPPIYLGFGSMTDPSPQASTQLVLEAVGRAGVRAVLSEGWAKLGAAPMPENVMVVGGVDHSSLFQRVSVVVHHGGAGTTTMAARAGTPQILVPHVLDQFHWARRVHERGLGPPALPRRKLTVEKLADSIRSLRGNELVSHSASALGERLRTVMQERADPADVIV